MQIEPGVDTIVTTRSLRTVGSRKDPDVWLTLNLYGRGERVLREEVVVHNAKALKCAKVWEKNNRECQARQELQVN